MEQPVLLDVQNDVAIITLNHEKALHALNSDMCDIIYTALSKWQNDETIRLVWLQHKPDTRGFCAGGDIRMLADSGKNNIDTAKAFFTIEYRLNHLIQTYKKPIISILDGITMGGGVGISVHGMYRVATENTVFAMPETGIGLIPDVGGGWFLPRLEGEIGTWLALTGARVKAFDTVRLGIATHYIPTDNLQTFNTKIKNSQDINQILNQAHQNPETETSFNDEMLEIINQCFAFDRAEDIRDALSKNPHPFAQKQLSILMSKSPLSVKTTLKQLRLGRECKTFAENMTIEYRLTSRLVQKHDFQEGVRALIIDKDNAPKWQNDSLDSVDTTEIDALFSPFPANQDWTVK